MSSNPFTSNRPRGYFAGAALLVVIGLVIGLGLSATLDLQRSSTAQKEVAAPTSTPAVNAIPESPFVSVVQQALPAVVFIDVRKNVTTGGPDDPQEELFRRFFHQDLPRRQETQPSSGSGFIIDEKGYVLTNNHVVRDAGEINVTLNDGRKFKAKVIGTDPETDVAVIKIDGDHLPALRLGDSDELRVGDWAIAIGNPLGVLRGSVTVGIISAQGRSDLNIFGGSPAFQDFIQTDASINFGNSGGPLCNIRGEAIGINTAINPSGQGIGFAIPINLAKHVSDQLIAHGQVKRAMLGVYLADLTPEIAEGFGIADEKGVIIQNVMDNSPAQRAGLERNDVVVEFDGQPVTELQKFRIRVADTPAGRKVPVVVLRGGKRMTFYVTLTDRPDEQTLAGMQPGGSNAEPESQNVSGLHVRTLTDEEKSSAKVDSGVMITDVDAGSSADDAGLEAGEIIEEVGGKAVNSAPDFAKMMGASKGQRRHAVLLVNNGSGQTRFVALRLQ
jgi:serine protease Do